jgi:serine phosphatase RsbU (regulator of sigma subunit)
MLSNLRFTLSVKWALALFVAFAAATLLLMSILRLWVTGEYVKVQQEKFEQIVMEADRLITSPEALLAPDSEARAYLNGASRFSNMQIVVSETEGVKLYDSMDFMSQYPHGRTELHVSSKDQAPKMRSRTTRMSNVQHYDPNRSYRFAGSLEDFSLVYYAALHDARSGAFSGQIMLAVSMAGLDETIARQRWRVAGLVAGLYIIAVLISIFFISRCVRRPTRQLTAICNRMADMNFDEKMEGCGKNEIGDLAAAFNTMAYSLGRSVRDFEEKNRELIDFSSELESRNQDLNRRQRMIEFDLRLAHRIQQELLPQIYPKVKGLQISAANFQVGEIGGDCFDFYKLDDGRLGAFIGDVSGKGISAALVMSMVTVLFSQLKDQYQSPSEILGKVNDIMYRHFGAQHSIYLTCFFVVVDMNEMTMTFSCAGHNPPFLFRPKTGEISPLEAEGFGLGMFSSVTFQEKTMPLQKGDKVILYTDGVVDSRNESGSMFGHDRLVQKVKENPNANSFRLTHFLVEELEEFAGDTPRQDDLTLLILEVGDEDNSINGKDEA